MGKIGKLCRAIALTGIVFGLCANESSLCEGASVKGAKSARSESASVAGFDQGAKGGDRATATIGGVEFAFRFCPPGTFTMGSPAYDEGSQSDETPHKVELTTGFWIMETEMTQEQWKAIAENNPSEFSGSDLPVENVSWIACDQMINLLNDMVAVGRTRGDKSIPSGWKFDLPTEAQWEYAYRAGKSGKVENLYKIAWLAGNSEGQPHAVGEKTSNPWGIRDMIGNVREWCKDWYDSKYYLSGELVDPQGPPSGNYRVVRGSGWDERSDRCRPLARDSESPNHDESNLGVRLVLVSRAAKETDVAAESSNPGREVKDLDGGKNAGDRATLKIDGVEYVFRYCPAGEFQMGSPDDEVARKDDELQHNVELTQGFWLMEKEVTQEQWTDVMGKNPSRAESIRLPVESVSWKDCENYVKKLNEQNALPDGWKFALPTEAQWEYACRAGSSETRYGQLSEIAWYDKNAKELRQGGQKLPNAWGLCDMLGNVREWTRDWYHKAFYSSGESTDPSGYRQGDRRVVRGGSFESEARECRAALRESVSPNSDYDDLGVRLALVQTDGDKYESNDGDEDGEIEIGKKTKIGREVDDFDDGELGGDRTTLTINGVDFTFRYCPAGKFEMGSPDDEMNRSDEEKRHEVKLTKGFWLLETEVTQEQWFAITNKNPSQNRGANRPVEQVSWNDCNAFIKKLNTLKEVPEGWSFSFPTEAQWEYACRAGSKGARYGNLDDIAWFLENDEGHSQPVGQKKPNAWGLRDMIGNVWELCKDRYADNYYESGETTDPRGPSSGTSRVIRGGDWNDDAKRCRASERLGIFPHIPVHELGLRLALIPASED
ncbi:MAG: SUMF1/EgtB/PvdO family nonheme iron enzyme [Thermoguttaceae bacterium]|nr:SUMF1/EgtB/PvdO family nonheme iron enzyme [Thermoguttaceae bacterium]